MGLAQCIRLAEVSSFLLGVELIFFEDNLSDLIDIYAFEIHYNWLPFYGKIALEVASDVIE